MIASIKGYPVRPFFQAYRYASFLSHLICLQMGFPYILSKLGVNAPLKQKNSLQMSCPYNETGGSECFFIYLQTYFILQQKVRQLRLPYLRQGLRTVVEGFRELGLVFGFQNSQMYFLLAKYFYIRSRASVQPPGYSSGPQSFFSSIPNQLSNGMLQSSSGIFGLLPRKSSEVGAGAGVQGGPTFYMSFMKEPQDLAMSLLFSRKSFSRSQRVWEEAVVISTPCVLHRSLMQPSRYLEQGSVSSQKARRLIFHQFSFSPKTDSGFP